MKNYILNQSIVDTYLRCPNCHSENSLEYHEERLICKSCGFKAKSRFGIPALIKNEEIGTENYNFLNIPFNERKNKNPYKKWKINPLQRFLFQEVIHFLNTLFFIYKFGLKKVLQPRYCREVEKAIYCGWTEYYNLILKASEIYQFNRREKYIAEPSLEIGCSNTQTTNMIFRDSSVESITFGCEYFMDSFLVNRKEDKLNNEMYKVIKYYIGGSVHSLPFKTSIFKTIIMVHIIDHIVCLDILFKEISRLLMLGGYLIISGYSKNVFENLLGVKVRKVFSKKWAEAYKNSRITKDNPVGCPLKSNFHYDAVGQSLFSPKEWGDIAKNHSLELIDYSFFGKYFSYFMDIEYRGYHNSIIFNQFLNIAISKIIEQEKEKPISEEESTNIILVFKKAENTPSENNDSNKANKTIRRD